jgi:hypothetical protein
MESREETERLVRFDLAQTARKAGLECPALVIECASTPAQWRAVAHDLQRARRVWGSHVPGLYAAHEAAEKLAEGNLDGALAALVDGCGMSPEMWLELTRGARAEAHS